MWQLIVSFGIFLFLLPYAYARFGYLSAQFLIAFHIFLGFPLRTFFISQGIDSANYIFPVLYFDERMYTTTLLFSASTTLFILIASFATKSTQSWPVRTPTQQSLPWSRVLLLAIVCIAAYLLLLTLFFGSLISAFGGFQSRTVDALLGYSYVNVLADIFFVSAVTLFYLWKHRGITDAKIASLILVVAALFLLSASGGRGNLIQALITLAIISSNGSRYLDRRAGIASLAIIFFVILIIPTGLAARKAAQFDTDFISELPTVYADIGPALSAPFALIDHFELSKEFVEVHGHDFGMQFLKFLVKPIPRATWPGKPQPIAIEMREEFYGDTLGGIPPGLAGELYISFGWASLIFLPVALILAIHLLFWVCKYSKFREHQPLIIGLIVPYIAFNMLRGGFDIGAMRILIILSSILFVIVVSSNSKRS